MTRPQRLFVVLSAIFLTHALLAEIVGIKIFSLEETFHLPQAQLPLLGDWILNFDLTAGVIMWPIVFVTTDIINEYFGERGVKFISFLTVFCILIAFIAIFIITLLPPSDFWISINNQDANGRYFNIDFAFSKIFTQSLGIILGSLTAFLIGQYLDVSVFQRLKKMTGEKKVWLRATGSTLVSQLIDSFVVLFIAFYFLAPTAYRWSFTQVVSVGVINYTYKLVVAILLTPLIYLSHFLIDRYLKDDAKRLKEKALSK